MATEAKRDILVITGNPVVETGVITSTFTMKADPERKLHPLPQKYGYVWKSKGNYPFNVFDRLGRGIAGAWSPKNDTVKWEKEMIDALPSCALLMDRQIFDWFEAMMQRHGVEFRHHHFDDVLYT